MRVRSLATVFAALSLVACATTAPVAYVSLAYTSSPSGALVERDGVTLGRTPMTLMIRVPLKSAESDDALTPGCLNPAAVTFRWASGVSAIVPNPCQTARVDAASIKKVPGSKNQYTASVLISAARPQDAPGLKRDLRTASALGSQGSLSFISPAIAHVDGWRAARSEAERYNTLYPTQPLHAAY